MIDKSVGLAFCGGDEDLYKEMVETYISDSTDNASRIEKLFKEQDWTEYAVAVHALKSTSKIVGATELSEMAARLEKAADERDEAVVNTEHSAMMKMYGSMVEKLKEEYGENTSSASPADGVLVFRPE